MRQAFLFYFSVSVSIGFVVVGSSGCCLVGGPWFLWSELSVGLSFSGRLCVVEEHILLTGLAAGCRSSDHRPWQDRC